MCTRERTRSHPISVAILCGGPSRRFGAEKARAMVGDRSLAEWIAGRLSGVSDDLFLQLAPGASPSAGLPARHDLVPGGCALSGIHGALSNARHERVFVCASDMPGVDPRLPRILARHEGPDAVVPRWVNGWIEPLCALYSRRAVEAAERRLEAGRYRLRDFLASLEWVEHVAIEPLMDAGALDGGTFVNINSRDELERWVSEAGVGGLTPGGRA